MYYEKYLRDRAYYEDLYDRHTIEKCLRNERNIMKEAVTDGTNLKIIEIWKPVVAEIATYFISGQRYEDRCKTIEEWIERDRRRDEQYANALEPKNVLCKFCDKQMEMFDKILDIGLDLERVMFLYRCLECKVGKKIFENGEVIDMIPWKCPDCSKRLTITHNRAKNTITTTEECPFCEYKNVDELDLTSKPEALPDPEKIKEYRLNRERFCLSEEQGKKYINEKISTEAYESILKAEKEKEKPKKIFVRSLSLEQVEKLLKQEVKSHGFIKFQMGKFEMRQGIMVDFTARDGKERNSREASCDLAKIIKMVLQDTNWHLMSEGVTAYLGVLSGRLRGVEQNDSHIQ